MVIFKKRCLVTKNLMIQFDKEETPFAAFTGKPGSGKDTLIDRLSEYFAIEKLSTGAEFRYHINNETEIGIKAKPYYGRDNVPDKITNPLVINAYDRVEDKIFAASGFPRGLGQNEAIKQIQREYNPLILHIYIDISDDTSVERIVGRAEREEDTKEGARERLRTFHGKEHRSIERLLADRTVKNLIIDGNASREEVFEQAKLLLDRHAQEYQIRPTIGSYQI